MSKRYRGFPLVRDVNDIIYYLLDKLKLEEDQKEDPLQEEEYVQEVLDKKVRLNTDRLKSYGL